MSFLTDKKKQHEEAALESLQRRDFQRAFAHTMKAAEFGVALAEQTQGSVSVAYLADVRGLLDRAETIKKKIGSIQSTALQASGGGSSSSNNTDEDNEDKALSETWLIREKPNVKLADVAGMAEVKQALQEDIMNAIAHPELYEQFGVQAGGGILLYGPPGTGKTFVAKAIAGELDAAFFAVSSSQIKNKYVGETEKNMRRLFEAAEEHPRSVIFLDEVEGLLGKRHEDEKTNAVGEFLMLADGIKKRKNTLLLLGGTNLPWLLDPAVTRPGRFGRLIYVGLPDADARESIFKLNLKVPMAPSIDLHDFAVRTEGYSGADIKAICDLGKKNAINRLKDGKVEKSVMLFEDLQSALDRTNKSVRPELVLQYEKWAADIATQG